MKHVKKSYASAVQIVFVLIIIAITTFSIWYSNRSASVAPGPQPGYAGTLSFQSSSSPSYLRINPKASLFPGTQSFTISFYLNLSSTGGSFPRVFALSSGDVGSGSQILAVSIEGGTFYLWSNDTPEISFDYSANTDSWHFVNIYGTSGSSLTVEIDGEVAGTSSSSYDITNPEDPTCFLNIGSYPQDVAQDQVSLQGYLANFRWVVGSAISINPKPSPPLPVIPSSTSLLLLSVSAETAFDDSGTDSSNTILTVIGPSPPTWSSQSVV